jgi:hypothetical protein
MMGAPVLRELVEPGELLQSTKRFRQAAPRAVERFVSEDLGEEIALALGYTAVAAATSLAA